MENKTQEEIEREMLALNGQFGEFLRTKGIGAKFRLAFANMGESARRQRERDKAQLSERKAQAAEENKEFVEFCHTKGLRAKCRLVAENVKAGAAEQAQRHPASGKKGMPEAKAAGQESRYTAEELSAAFNEFLAAKGLDGEYVAIVNKEKE